MQCKQANRLIRTAGNETQRFLLILRGFILSLLWLPSNSLYSFCMTIIGRNMSQTFEFLSIFCKSPQLNQTILQAHSHQIHPWAICRRLHQERRTSESRHSTLGWGKLSTQLDLVRVLLHTPHLAVLVTRAGHKERIVVGPVTRPDDALMRFSLLAHQLESCPLGLAMEERELTVSARTQQILIRVRETQLGDS